MHGLINGKKHKSQYRRWHRHFRGESRAAVARGFTAARLVLGLPVPQKTIAAVAVCCGSNTGYVKAAIDILKTEDANLFRQVLEGHRGLLATAAAVRNRGALIDAFRAASSDDRVAFAKTIGAETLFDNVVVPAA
jgi:hypothetical protein